MTPPDSPKRPARLPDPERRRHTPRGFSWIDHRLLRDGHLAACACAEALALYLVLVAASDARGVSYYGDKRLAGLLALPGDGLGRARRRLVECGLIAWSRPYYQVLSLDPDDIRRSRLRRRPPGESGPGRAGRTMDIREVLLRMAGKPSGAGDGPGPGAPSRDDPAGPKD